MAVGNTTLVIGNEYDLIWADGPQSKLIKALKLASVDDDFLTFTLNDGRPFIVGRRYVIKIEAVRNLSIRPLSTLPRHSEDRKIDRVVSAIEAGVSDCEITRQLDLTIQEIHAIRAAMRRDTS